MIRNIGLEDIYDGRLYSENDLVRTDTNNCSGCKKICCIGMGKTIVLDPYDCFRLTSGTGKAFEALVNDNIELNVVDGCILPILRCRIKLMPVHFLILTICVVSTDTDRGYAVCFHLEDTGRMMSISTTYCRRANVTRITSLRLR